MLSGNHRTVLTFILLVGVYIVASQNGAWTSIYLSRNDSGTFLLTNESPSRVQSQRYKLLIKSDTESGLNVPDPGDLKRFVRKASIEHRVPQSLIYAVIEVESDGETQALSGKGARGLMQLMPETARDLGVSDPLDPRQNIFGGAKYLKKMLNQFDGDLEQALAAYNAGPTRVRKHDGIPPYRETQQFVQRVKTWFGRFKTRDDMIYTYRDRKGILHVVNLH